MKKQISVIIVVLMAIVGAQGVNAQFRWNVTAGPTVNSLKFKQDILTIDKTVGYTGGINGEMMFPGIGFGIDFGLLYNQMGAKVDFGEYKMWASEGYGNEQLYIHNITVPVHLRFKWTRMNGLEDKIAPLIFGGPEFSIQVAHGKCDAVEYSGGDLGLTFGGGVELFKNWQVTAQYTWGMTYVLKTKLLDNFSARSRQLTVRAAYFF